MIIECYHFLSVFVLRFVFHTIIINDRIYYYYLKQRKIICNKNLKEIVKNLKNFKEN